MRINFQLTLPIYIEVIREAIQTASLLARITSKPEIFKNIVKHTNDLDKAIWSSLQKEKNSRIVCIYRNANFFIVFGW